MPKHHAKTKLEKLAPEEVMPDEQLFTIDTKGHESISIQKMKARAGRIALPAAAKLASADTSYDAYIPTKKRKAPAPVAAIEKDPTEYIAPRVVRCGPRILCPAVALLGRGGRGPVAK